MTKEQILELTSASDLVALDNVIALIYPYNPYVKHNDILNLDSYYVASNKAHINAKKSNLGTVTNNINIKELLGKCGLKKGVSSLMIHPEYGSYFLVQALIPTFEFKNTTIKSFDILCEKCKRCIKACPSSAININGINKATCVRAMMDDVLCTASLPYLGNNLLGCQICREVCPHNAFVQQAEVPSDLHEALDIKSLLKFEKPTQETLSNYIGKNMARASIILPQAMAYTLKHELFDLIPYIEVLLHHPSHKVASSASLILDKLTLISN